ncbi:hypothetical protein ACF1G5_36025 [Streptomyces coeruleorubidus]|uniref:hypothetical protein n=1 Tax=Streptomyces coeruleorubidus TaxID=116188 RepID=UPI0036F5BA23
MADAEGFWAWVDSAELGDSPDKWLDAPDEVKEWRRERASAGRTRTLGSASPRNSDARRRIAGRVSRRHPPWETR